MTARLPLFPLGTVLFPGLVLPLHLFEERYRLLMRDLLKTPEPRRLGVVAIELGHEVGAGAARRLAAVGCTAELRTVRPHADGRFDVVTVGTARFRLKEVDRSGPYPVGEVEHLGEEVGAGAEAAAAGAARLFRVYRERLLSVGAEVEEPSEPPVDPVRLSYLIAAAAVLDPGEEQLLLEAEDAASRLRLEQDLLEREIRLLEVLPSVPAGRFLSGAVHPN